MLCQGHHRRRIFLTTKPTGDPMSSVPSTIEAPNGDGSSGTVEVQATNNPKKKHAKRKKEKTQIHLRVDPATLDSLDKLQHVTSQSNRTMAVKQAIKLASRILQETEDGSRIIIEAPDGEKKELVLIG